MNAFTTFLLFLTLVLSPEILAGTISKLINSPTRPTIREIKEVLDPWPLENPFGGVHDDLTETLSKTVPRLIVRMEKAYPGAIWAPLGRDAVFFGDVLDAFYEAVGERGRVRRLNLSGESFTNAGPVLLYDFLTQKI